MKMIRVGWLSREEQRMGTEEGGRVAERTQVGVKPDALDVG